MTPVGNVHETPIENLYEMSLKAGFNKIIEGAFVATNVQMATLIGKTCNFGNVFGDGKDAIFMIRESDVKLNTSNKFVVQMAKKIGQVGFNPLEYIVDE